MDASRNDPERTDPLPAGGSGASYLDHVPDVNTLAIAALVFSILIPPAGIVMAHVARTRMRRTGEVGKTATTVALVIGYSLLLCLCCLPAGILLI